MKSIEFQTIGRIDMLHGEDKCSKLIRLVINKELKDALIKLEHFSHGVVFTKDESGIYCYAVKIIEVSDKSGELVVETNTGIQGFKGDLIDIKPYFPCEEVAEDNENIADPGEAPFSPIPFKGDFIGEYLYANNCGLIKLQKSETLSAVEIADLLGRLKPGDYVRVLWWFHRFDNKRYRSHLMCNPPYDNAPRSGVFATRSPVRPNPLASTIVKVKSIDIYNQCMAVLGFDGFEHSKVLQLMPYQADAFKDIRVPKWVGHWANYKAFHDYPEMTFSSDEEKHPPREAEAAFFEELEGGEAYEKDYTDTNEIVVENASIHNLKDISVRIPKGKITVITGVSGSGKSSLAFDTIYHESQRQFMDLAAANPLAGTDLKDSMVKRITGLQPSIAIEQKNLGVNPRSTVASVTRVGEYLRLLFAAIGERVCPGCFGIIPENNVCQGCGTVYFTLVPSVFNHNHPEYMCPVCKGLGEELQPDIELIVSDQELSILDGASDWWGNLRKHSENPNANWMKGEVLALAADMKEDLEVPFKDLSEAFKQQIFYGSSGREVTLYYENTNGRNGTIRRPVEGVVNTLKRLLAECSGNKSIEHIERFMVNRKCSRCNGERLLEEGRLVRIGSTRYPEATMMSITRLKKWCHSIYGSLDNIKRDKCRAILVKIIARLKRLEQAGIGYLNLDRSIPSLSGGEAQRLKIATQFGSGLSNILYVMDEPSKGLHPRDFRFLTESIRELKRQNNTVIVVEHKKEFVNMADFLVEIGPGAGYYGGQLLRAEAVEKPETPDPDDCDYIIVNDKPEAAEMIVLKGARTNNLKNVDISIPISRFTCVVGVSGSGKSSLISRTLYPAIRKGLGKRVQETGEYDSITGIDRINDIYFISQKAIGKNSRSTPGTYTGVFDLIRDFYASLTDAGKMKLTKEHFSFNSTKGQCEECRGAGEVAVPMYFAPDIYITCSKCNGKRYREHVLKVRYMGYSIADLLELEIGEVKELFKGEAKIYGILDMLDKVGLSYVKLGQSATSLSGGEAQRIKLAKELCDGRTKGAVYILDEPTTGLHDDDVGKLGAIISELTLKGATVIAIEHNPILIKQADYLIETGPEGGDGGGYVLREGWLQ